MGAANKFLPIWCLLTPLLLSACGDVKDEAANAGRDARSFPAASENYFQGMDDECVTPSCQKFTDKDGVGVLLTQDEIKGRNTWMVWTGGNDRFWDYFAKHGFGAFDLLKVLSSSPYSGFCYRPDDSDSEKDCRSAGGHWYVKNDKGYKGFCGIHMKPENEHSRYSRKSCAKAGYQWYSTGRSNRWKWYGVVNEPCFEEARKKGKYGLWLDRRDDTNCPPDPFANEDKYPGVKIGARGKTVPVGSYYGEPSGVVGLRLFPNPDFDEEAQKKWDPDRYYNDPVYYKDKNLVRPYRVGMSCGFCHVGPKPTIKAVYGSGSEQSCNADDCFDPENPKWTDLSTIVGAQYLWIDRVFLWESDWSNFLYQIVATFRPGTLDTSYATTDYIANPRTQNALYHLGPRLGLANRWGRAKLAGGELENIQIREFDQMPKTVWTPRVLKDGSDSVGVLGALNRVYMNIGLFSEGWLQHVDFLLGATKPISTIRIADAKKNSVYWQATEKQTRAMAKFLIKVSATPHHLEKNEKNTGKPVSKRYDQYSNSFRTDAAQSVDRSIAGSESSATAGVDHGGKNPSSCGRAFPKGEYPALDRGKLVFADHCARCHSSKIPKMPKSFGALDFKQGCAGPNYLRCWNAYWRWTETDEFRCTMREVVLRDDFLKDNFLSTDLRVPVTLLKNNACAPLATNAIAGNIWDNFSSQSYKHLPSVGSITVHNPFNGETRSYVMPAGGRGYTRVPSLVSVWSTAPLLLNNSVGPFTYGRVSIEARERAFGTAMEQLLSPQCRSFDTISNIRLPGVIDRTTVDSYFEIPPSNVPSWLRWSLRQVCPGNVDDRGFVRLGPIPKDTPIGVLSNIEIWPDGGSPTQKLWHITKLLTASLPLVGALCSDGISSPNSTDFNKVLEPLLKFNKCPDFVVNKGHYFGTELSDDEKRDLIEFVKTF
jgi:hypothetical protein